MLCGKAALLIESGETISEPLASYIASKLFDSFFAKASRRGADGDANVVRDIIILNFVSSLWEIGVHPTRNEASRDKEGADSGCSLVAEVMQELGFHIDERGVEKVWRGRNSKPWAWLDR